MVADRSKFTFSTFIFAQESAAMAYDLPFLNTPILSKWSNYFEKDK